MLLDIFQLSPFPFIYFNFNILLNFNLYYMAYKYEMVYEIQFIQSLIFNLQFHVSFTKLFIRVSIYFMTSIVKRCDNFLLDYSYSGQKLIGLKKNQ